MSVVSKKQYFVALFPENVIKLRAQNIQELGMKNMAVSV